MMKLLSDRNPNIYLIKTQNLLSLIKKLFKYFLFVSNNVRFSFNQSANVTLFSFQINYSLIIFLKCLCFWRQRYLRQPNWQNETKRVITN